MICQVVAFLVLCTFSLGLAAGPAGQTASLNAQAEKGPAGDVSSQPLFRYKAGLLNGRAEKKRLEIVLSELGKAAKVESVLKFKTAEDEVVSFRVKDMILADGLKEILRNYNYIFIPAGNAGEASKLILLGGKASADSREASLPIQEEGITAAAVEPENEPAGPWNLDEFQKLDRASMDGAIDMAPEQREALEREQREQRKNRALDVLESEHAGLKEAAINELMGMDDPEATNALLDTALRAENVDLKQIAAEALWRHAADLEYKNAEANQALSTLAEKGDATTKEYAQRALEDAERYTANNPPEN